MVYNNKIYVPIQAWSHAKDTGSNHVATSGFMVSENNGQDWKVSSMISPNIDDRLNGTDTKMNTSESNIFHYKGKIRLAVRHETGYPDPNDKNNKGQKLRLCYEYDEKNDSWTLVDEPYIPKDVAMVETSTHNLSEDVYLVGYTSYKHVPGHHSGNDNR